MTQQVTTTETHISDAARTSDFGLRPSNEWCVYGIRDHPGKLNDSQSHLFWMVNANDWWTFWIDAGGLILDIQLDCQLKKIN